MFSNYQLHVLSAPDHANNEQAPDTGANQRFEFRTPTLRNLSETAPYMHSGALATLAEVMAFYEDLEEGEVRHASVPRSSLDPLVNNIRGVEDGQAAILEFLRALDDPAVDRSVPGAVPSGLPVGGSIN
jgi:cytochrome c peroxidase